MTKQELITTLSIRFQVGDVQGLVRDRKMSLLEDRKVVRVDCLDMAATNLCAGSNADKYSHSSRSITLKFPFIFLIRSSLI